MKNPHDNVCYNRPHSGSNVAVMASVPGSELLPPQERQLFVEQFEKDLQFFQLFFLLINRSCPIRNIDLVWAEHGPSGRVSLRHMGITEALAGPCSRLLGARKKQNPHPAFCNLINDYGRHEAETCEVSDKAAEEVVHRTRRAHVYQCHFGLTDIAVPVTIKGQHVATLLTGQVLRQSPCAEGFVQIAAKVETHAYVDKGQLEQAYWKVPVVTEEDIRNTTEILEAFAQYLASSWERLSEAVKERRRRDRELQLLRKEFAYLALGGSLCDRTEAQAMMRKLGFSQPPTRALVVKLEMEEERGLPAGSLDMNFTASVQAIEELCEKLDNVTAAYLRNGGVCVFFHDPKRASEKAGDFYAHRMANRILYAVRERSDLRVRIGIGSRKRDWRGLSQSHQEACTALLTSDQVIANYRRKTTSFEDLSRVADTILQMMRENRLEEVKPVVSSLPALVSRLASDPGTFAGARLFLSSTLESMCFTARGLGCDVEAIDSVCSHANAQLDRAANAFELRDAWFRSAGEVLDEVRRLYAGKRKKIVERACRIVENQLEHSSTPQKISIGEIASALGISADHLSRVFKRDTGQTLEHYLMAKRVEISKRLLLDPVSRISEVARRCGFSDSSYFARVFRMVAGCSPREFCRAPGGMQPSKATGSDL
jgi:AraC-like DNA-binding protein/ligand-binding sensor protein